MNDNHARLSPALVETIAGLSAGIITTLTVHPLDVIKTRLQIHRGTPATPTTPLRILRALASNEKPIQSLYRGLAPNLLGNATSWALFFYAKSKIETSLLLFHNRSSSPSSTPKGREALTPVDYFISAGGAGIITNLSTNPIWVLKTRMLSSDKTSTGAYQSMLHGALSLYKSDGLFGFWRGAGISLLGNSHGAVQFAVYEPLKSLWKRYIIKNGEGKEGDKMSNGSTMVISGCSKIVAGTVTYPFQVVRSRLQTYDSEKVFGKGIRGVARRIWREEGGRGFYRGLGTNVVRVLPATWVTFLIYENVRFYVPVWAGMRGKEGTI